MSTGVGSHPGRCYLLTVGSLEARHTITQSGYISCKYTFHCYHHQTDKHQPVLLLASSEEIVLRVTDLSEGRHEEGGGLEICGLENIEPDIHLSVRLFYVVSARGSFS